jgi:hypothetical protein
MKGSLSRNKRMEYVFDVPSVWVDIQTEGLTLKGRVTIQLKSKAAASVLSRAVLEPSGEICGTDIASIRFSLEELEIPLGKLLTWRCGCLSACSSDRLLDWSCPSLAKHDSEQYRAAFPTWKRLERWLSGQDPRRL